jgi:hypothetical protein
VITEQPGFPKGVLLQSQFKQLKGTGKTHRHLSINEELVNKSNKLNRIILVAFESP